MNQPSANTQRRNAIRNENPRFNLGPGGANRGPSAVLKAAFRRQLRRDFTEHLRLQFREPGEPAAHAPCSVVLRKAIGCYQIREAGVIISAMLCVILAPP